MPSSPEAGKAVEKQPASDAGARHEGPMPSSGGGGGSSSTSKQLEKDVANSRPETRRNSTASSIHSVGGALDVASNSGFGPNHDPGQNAIATLLQLPIVRAGQKPYTTASASSNFKPPTARDIPPVALTNIPHVDNEEFAPYFAEIAPLLEQLKRFEESEEDASPTPRRNSRREDQPDGSAADGHLRPGPTPSSSRRRGSSASIASTASAGVSSPARRPKRTSQGPPPLSSIPPVYFNDDFHLENPRTFDVVSERSEVIRTPSKGEANGAATAPRKALATNAILQEKLSWYMDTIEVHLIDSISTASTSFFSALGSLKELHTEASDSVQRIGNLRKELKALDAEIASSGIEIIEKRQRQENMEKLNDAVEQLRQVVDGVLRCESLVEAGEVDEALTSIDRLERFIAGESEQQSSDAEGDAPSTKQLLDLRSAAALEGVGTDLSMLRFRAGKAYESQFSSILVADLRRHVSSVSRSDVLLRWSHAAARSRGGQPPRAQPAAPTHLTTTEELREKLIPMMAGLHRAKHVAAAALAYREAVLREVRNLIRRPLPSSNDDDNESMVSMSTASGSGKQRSNQDKSASLARNLRALAPEEAEELLVTMYIGVTETLRRLTTQVKVLLDIASSLTQPEAASEGFKSPLPPPRTPEMPPVTSPRPERSSNEGKQAAGAGAGTAAGGGRGAGGFTLQEELHKTLDEATLLTQAVDVAHDRIVKVLKVRSEQATHLSLPLFLRYFTLNLYFANECEAVSGRSGTSLKTVVNGQIKEFVQRNRDAEMQRLAQGMESDQWNARDFDEKHSRLLAKITLGDDVANAWIGGNEIWSPYRGDDDDHDDVYSNSNNNNNNNGDDSRNAKDKDKLRSATIESEKYVLPGSAMLCLEGIANFMHLVAGIPSMTTDVASSLIAYLQLFNSRCTQLILGAGATRSAGLKNITTKHLALASRALSFTAALVPHVRDFVRRHAGSGAGASSLAAEFDKVRRLLQEHQESIHQKLVDIMSGRAAVHAKSIKSIDWTSGGESDAPHAYMETLTKETTTLHRVLTKHLPAASIQVIMEPVFASYREQLGGALGEADPKTSAGRESMLRDIDALSAKLGKVDGFGDTGDFLTHLVKAKHVLDESSAEDAVAGDGAGDEGGDDASGGEDVQDGEGDEARATEQGVKEET